MIESTNKVIEIMVTLFFIYVLLELDKIPEDCPDGHLECLSTYVTNMNASGKDPDLSVLMTPCSDLLESCVKGYIGVMKIRGELNDTISMQVDAHKNMIEYCKCLWALIGEVTDSDSTDQLFCDFYKFIIYAVVVGIVVLFGAEFSNSLDLEGDEPIPPPKLFKAMIFRIVCLAVAVIYFIITIPILDKGFDCYSKSFDDKEYIVNLITGFAAGLIGGSGGVEVFFWIAFWKLHGAKKEDKKGDEKKEPVEMKTTSP